MQLHCEGKEEHDRRRSVPDRKDLLMLQLRSPCYPGAWDGGYKPRTGMLDKKSIKPLTNKEYANVRGQLEKFMALLGIERVKAVVNRRP